MFSKFFIERPIFASVLAIIIMLAGLVASSILPVAQYPEIAPPTVTITASYPGASAETLAKTVAAPIEEQLSGVENLIYFNSSAAADGSVDDHRDVRGRHRRRQGGVPGQQPRAARAAAPARGSAPQRRHRAEALERHPARRRRCNRPTARARHDCSWRTTRPVNLIDELKRVAGRRRRRRSSAPRLLDAHLAAARQDGAPRRDADRHRQRDPRAERAVRRGQDRRRAGAAGPGARTTPSPRAGAWSSPRSSATSSCAPAARAACCASRTSRASSSARRATTPARRVDGNPAVGMAVFLQTGANALEVAAAVKARMVELKTAFPDRTSTT